MAAVSVKRSIGRECLSSILMEAHKESFVRFNMLSTNNESTSPATSVVNQVNIQHKCLQVKLHVAGDISCKSSEYST